VQCSFAAAAVSGFDSAAVGGGGALCSIVAAGPCCAGSDAVGGSSVVAEEATTACTTGCCCLRIAMTLSSINCASQFASLFRSSRIIASRSARCRCRVDSEMLALQPAASPAMRWCCRDRDRCPELLLRREASRSAVNFAIRSS